MFLIFAFANQLSCGVNSALCMDSMCFVSRYGEIENLLQGTEELEVRIMVQARPGQDIR